MYALRVNYGQNYKSGYLQDFLKPDIIYDDFLNLLKYIRCSKGDMFDSKEKFEIVTVLELIYRHHDIDIDINGFLQLCYFIFSK